MIELPTEIYLGAQVRDLDRTAIEVFGIPSYDLMCRAAQAALDCLSRHWPSASELTILCGAGNNAGDGYVLARLAAASGTNVRVLSLVPADRLGGDALRAYEDFTAAGGIAEAFDAAEPLTGELLVDALLGTGLDRLVEGRFAEAVAAINGARAPVLALDIPSGLHADTGLPLGVAVSADVTITFVGLKQGLYLGEGMDRRGWLEFAGLGVPAQAYVEVSGPLRRLDAGCIRQALPPRRRTAHKGAHGSLLLVGGAPGMSGAIRLAAEAALRAGAGLVRVASHADSAGIVTAGRPEIMCHAVAGADELGPLLAQSDAIVLGPGLGRSDWAQSLWQASLAADLPLVIDADGLNELADAPQKRDSWILTPHPGEAGRLLGTATGAVQADRLGAVRALAGRYGGLAVLKGAGSLIAAADEVPVSVCDRGNPGMATAGMGDVLSGV
ncbi:MAG: NAD(P)H-hydrate dehydratase, partial [Gammaproteobacteria bacterium]|nr:NAD(P)H-hydrate dehydratase [Gammaproteobacteria bacterium]